MVRFSVGKMRLEIHQLSLRVGNLRLKKSMPVRKVRKVSKVSKVKPYPTTSLTIVGFRSPEALILPP